ncbi:MAG: carboxypeptidase-like regulatory domain-containing protein [Rhodothermales bacterium]|nr:carboxypeptidase-like regulatory domain-containing protein [Rhodothermales bacterium]
MSDPGRHSRWRIQTSALLLSLLLGLFWLDADAQSLYRGYVIDAESGESLPAASIRIEGTSAGTITNSEGYFSLPVNRVPATAIFRYVGYQSEKISLTRNGPFEIRVALRRAIVPLGEVVVTGENPAREIMRRVIARKQEMRESLSTYKANAYNRFTVQNDTGIVSIIESFTEAYWRKGDGLREVNLSQRQTRNLLFEELLPAATFVANLYDDNIDIGGFNLRGVTHPEALNHYRFFVSDYVYLDDQLVYEIQVEPATSRKVGFRGYIRVLAEEFVLLEVNLTPGKAIYFPPPFEDVRTVMYQQYSDFGNGQWLPSDLHTTTEIKIAFGPLVDIPRITVDQLSRLSDYQINTTVPDSLFAAERNDIVVEGARQSADSLDAWTVPLTDAEFSAYNDIDSTLSMEKAFAPGGLLGRMAGVNISADDQDQESAQQGLGADTRFIPNVAFNRVEGFRIGLDAKMKIGTKTQFRPVVGGTYQSARKAWSYKVGGGFVTGGRTYVELDVLYERGIRSTYRSDVNPVAITSLLSLFGHPDYYDYYLRKGVVVNPHVTLTRSRVTIGATLDVSTFGSVRRNTSYDLVGRGKVQRSNPAVGAGDFRSVGANIVINEPETSLPVTGARSLSMNVEYSSPDFLGSDVDFLKFGGTADWRFSTFQRRRLVSQTLDVKLVGAVHQGETPLQKMSIVDVSNGPFTPFGSLRSAGDIPFQGDEVVAVFWEHNFRSALFEVLGAWSLARNGISLTIFGGHARTDISQSAMSELSFDPPTTMGWYHEAGLSVGGLLGIFRLDVAHEIGGNNFGIGVSAARLF